MIESFARRVLTPALLRLALATVFIFHGLAKVNVEHGMGWANQMPNPPTALVQAIVAWSELIGGIAIAVGLLTRVASLAIIAIMIGAVVTVHGSHGFAIKDGGYEYNFVLILAAAALAATGAGLVSLDHVIRSKMKGPANY
ncbi:MAG: DoxX family protein [Gemmataceae bacterium]